MISAALTLVALAAGGGLAAAMVPVAAPTKSSPRK